MVKLVWTMMLFCWLFHINLLFTLQKLRIKLFFIMFGVCAISINSIHLVFFLAFFTCVHVQRSSTLSFTSVHPLPLFTFEVSNFFVSSHHGRNNIKVVCIFDVKPNKICNVYWLRTTHSFASTWNNGYITFKHCALEWPEEKTLFRIVIIAQMMENGKNHLKIIFNFFRAKKASMDYGFLENKPGKKSALTSLIAEYTRDRRDKIAEQQLNAKFYRRVLAVAYIWSALTIFYLYLQPTAIGILCRHIILNLYADACEYSFAGGLPIIRIAVYTYWTPVQSLFLSSLP